MKYSWDGRIVLVDDRKAPYIVYTGEEFESFYEVEKALEYIDAVGGILYGAEPMPLEDWEDPNDDMWFVRLRYL
jgi:hypothetical protein